MMTIRNVGRRHCREGLHPFGSAGDAPEGVPDAVGCREVVQWRLLRLRIHERRHGGVVAIGEKHRAGVRAQRVDEPGAVVLFVLARLLVLLDQARVVVVDMAAGN